MLRGCVSIILCPLALGQGIDTCAGQNCGGASTTGGNLLQRQSAIKKTEDPSIDSVFDAVDTNSNGQISKKEMLGALDRLVHDEGGGGEEAPIPVPSPPPAPPSGGKSGKGGGGKPAPAPSGGGGGKSDCEGGTIPDCPSCGTKYELTKDEMCRHLTIHNKLRACVKPKPPPLSWDCKLMCQIQEYVDKGNSGHSDCYGSPIKAGENMAMWMPQDRRFPYKAEWMWFDSEYSYRGGHYTAMIWSSSKSLGCAINTDKNLVFCQYANAAANFGSTSDPNNAGNFDGNYAACGITEKEKACWSASTASACD